MPPGPLASKHPFLLVRPPKLAITAEEDVDASSIAMDDDADEWRVVWLIRKGDGKWSGGGFSGGWRGCAIDLKLAVGDAIVFEVLPGRRDGLLALQMRVFRARDPATIRPTWEALEEMMNDDQDANNAAEERREKVSSTATATATAFEYSAKAIDSRGGKPNARRQSEGERLLLNSGVVALHSSSEEEDEEERPKKKQKRMRAPVAPTQRAKLPSAPSAGAKAGVKAWGPAMIGARVEKEFDGEMYAGEVTSYDPTEDWYKVVYEDGDREEIDVCLRRNNLLVLVRTSGLAAERENAAIITSVATRRTTRATTTLKRYASHATHVRGRLRDVPHPPVRPFPFPLRARAGAAAGAPSPDLQVPHAHPRHVEHRYREVHRHRPELLPRVRQPLLGYRHVHPQRVLRAAGELFKLPRHRLVLRRKRGVLRPGRRAGLQRRVRVDRALRRGKLHHHPGARALRRVRRLYRDHRGNLIRRGLVHRHADFKRRIEIARCAVIHERKLPLRRRQSDRSVDVEVTQVRGLVEVAVVQQRRHPGRAAGAEPVVAAHRGREVSSADREPSTSDVSVAPLAAKHTEIFSTTSTKISFRLPPLALSRAVARTLRCVASRLAVPPGVCVGAAFAAAASFPYSIPAFTTPLKTPYGVEALLTAADALAAAAPAPVVADEAGVEGSLNTCRFSASVDVDC
eukprot:30797-Pelagococcus_subviridis.AAC.9